MPRRIGLIFSSQYSTRTTVTIYASSFAKCSIVRIANTSHLILQNATSSPFALRWLRWKVRRNNTENAWSSDYYHDFFSVFRQFSHVNCAHIAANFQSNIRPSVCVFTCIRTRAIWVDFCTATKSHAYAFFALSLIFATDVNILAPIMECFIYSSCGRGKTTRISCFALRRLQIIYLLYRFGKKRKNEWMNAEKQ